MKLQEKKNKFHCLVNQGEERLVKLNSGKPFGKYYLIVPTPILRQQYIEGHLKNGLTVTVEFDLH